MADTVRDIALDTDGDLKVEAGDLVLVSGADAIVQAVRIRLQFFRGEWFLDLSAGLPWFQSVLIKNPDPNILHTVFRDEILGTPGILSLSSLTLTSDTAARTLTVRYRADSDVGELVSTEVI